MEEGVGGGGLGTVLLYTRATMQCILVVCLSFFCVPSTQDLL